MLKIGEVAAMLGVCVASVRKWCNAGMIEYTLLPNPSGKHRHRRFKRSDVEQFAKKYGLDIQEQSQA